MLKKLPYYFCLFAYSSPCIHPWRFVRAWILKWVVLQHNSIQLLCSPNALLTWAQYKSSQDVHLLGCGSSTKAFSELESVGWQLLKIWIINSKHVVFINNCHHYSDTKNSHFSSVFSNFNQILLNQETSRTLIFRCYSETNKSISAAFQIISSLRCTDPNTRICAFKACHSKSA